MEQNIVWERRVKECLTSNNRPYVFLDTARFDSINVRSFLFDDFQGELIFKPSDNIEFFFERIDTYLKRGFWLAGFFSYEFGYLLEEKLITSLPKALSLPLVWLGIFRDPFIFSHSHKSQIRFAADTEVNYKIKNLKPKIPSSYYFHALKRIKRYIEEGETYQVNFTFPLRFEFRGRVDNLYFNLREFQPTSYMAFIATGNDHILSFSPELFFSLKNKKIIVRPMKGTIGRGRFLGEDRRQALALKRSVKNRAENIMIVDLLRNDLGKIAERGKVRTVKIFSLEKYPTLWQMTSTIEAEVKEDICAKDIFCALFPSGSVTGAPKIRTMQIIRELEKYPRGVYCGAIGYISPYGQMCFNVAIRTIHIDRKNRGALGVGGGIVYDSVDNKEYKEAVLKADFLVKKFSRISLIETMRYSYTEGFCFLDLHLKRLKSSCGYFDIPFRKGEIKEKLFSWAKLLDKTKTYKARVLVNREGKISISFQALEEIEAPVSIKLSTKPVESTNIYLYHKTTVRSLYDQERQDALKEGFWEVIFINERGELTEGTVTNLFILKGNKLLTPPLKCGLLDGVLRRYLLDTKRAQEATLYPKDLFEAEEIYVGNSVRGLTRASVSAHLDEILLERKRCRVKTI